MPNDNKQLRSLLGGLSYYRKFLPDMARRIRPITALLKKGATFDFTPTMEDTVRTLPCGTRRTADPCLARLGRGY